MQVINAKIDVSKIDKSRLYKGAKGTYLSVTIFLKDEEDQYGNHGMIVEATTKAERDAGMKGAIIGNVQLTGAKPTAQEPDGLAF